MISLAIACLALTGCRQGGGAPILLFTGSGTSVNDFKAVERVLSASKLSFSTANSWQLNRMAEPQLLAYRLLIVPGGNFIEIGNGLTPAATANIRGAVQHGLNYLGICAGGFFAGNSGFNSLNLTGGVRFGFYAAANQGIRKAAVRVEVTGEPARDHYWEDGPQFSGWGKVVGTYPDRTPAIVEGRAGSGWVLLVS